MKPKIACSLACILVTALFTSGVEADCDLPQRIGWTIFYSGTVDGYINEDGEKESDFEGCKRGRILIIDPLKSVQCLSSSYGYYGYDNPDITILRRKFTLEEFGESYGYRACIDDDWYHISIRGDWSDYEKLVEGILP